MKYFLVFVLIFFLNGYLLSQLKAQGNNDKCLLNLKAAKAAVIFMTFGYFEDYKDKQGELSACEEREMLDFKERFLVENRLSIYNLEQVKNYLDTETQCWNSGKDVFAKLQNILREFDCNKDTILLFKNKLNTIVENVSGEKMVKQLEFVSRMLDAELKQIGSRKGVENQIQKTEVPGKVQREFDRQDDRNGNSNIFAFLFFMSIVLNAILFYKNTLIRNKVHIYNSNIDKWEENKNKLEVENQNLGIDNSKLKIERDELRSENKDLHEEIDKLNFKLYGDKKEKVSNIDQELNTQEKATFSDVITEKVKTEFDEKIFYLVPPYEELYFNGGEVTDEANSNTCYRAEMTSINEAKFYIEPYPKLLKKILNSPEIFIKRVGIYENHPEHHHTTVKTKEPGKIEKKGDDWYVAQKIKVEFS